MSETPPVAPVQPDLGNLTPAAAAMATRIAIGMLSGFLLKYASTIFPADTDAQVATQIVSILTPIAMGLWGYLSVRLRAREKVAAAATGNPKANPAAPVVQEAVAAKIADPTSPIRAAA